MSYARPPEQPYAHSNASQYEQASAYYQQQQQGSDGYGHGSQGTYGHSQGGYGEGVSGGSYGGGYKYDDQQSSMFAPSEAHHHGQSSAALNTPYSDFPPTPGQPRANAASAAAQKYSYAPQKKGVSKWIKIGIPLLLLIIAGAVLGGIFGSRAANKDSSASSTKSGWTDTTSGDKPSFVGSDVLQRASAAAASGNVDDLQYHGTDAYGNPSFKSSATQGSPSASNGYQVDSFSGSLQNLRSHPRIMTTQQQWQDLPGKISKDAYLTVWNDTIFKNATAWFPIPPTNYSIDGGFTGSGILDPARELQQRVKTFAYAYHLSGGDTKWRDRAWSELNTAAGNNPQYPWGEGAPDGSIWNANHFLDLAEATAAFAIGYDWLYDAWTDDQRTTLRNAIATNGLVFGNNAYTGQNDGGNYGWWHLPANGFGNWNCVSNSGLLLGALAIAGDDGGNTTISTLVSQTFNNVLDNMKQNCMQGVYSDGTWSETPNYWYFGTNAQARAVSALTTATGSDQGLMAANNNWPKTGYFHMYVSGMASMFFYGDNGPNKFSTNANGMFLWGALSNNPVYALFQRDRADAADPLSMFWYDPSTKGAFWSGLDLDRYFDDRRGSWASMRSSWTDFTGMYAAIKSSNLTGHQTHGDLDAGTFVIDALGTRWAGELGNGNYLSTDYFKEEVPTALRWGYYKKATQGQNTLVINDQNQMPDCQPINKFETTGAKQSSSVSYTPGTNDVAYFSTDMSSAYNNSGSAFPANTVKRGIRMLNGRRQVLVQDDIGANGGIQKIQWRVQTNATITLSADRRTATLTLDNATDPNAWGGNTVAGPAPLIARFAKQTMIVKILSPATATFGVTSFSGNPEQKPTRIYGTDPNTTPGEQGDQPMPGRSVLTITLDGGDAQSIQVLWQPQWSNLNDADNKEPPNVPIDNWSLTSHN
ncbi:Heparinase II/III-like [Ceraceosorus bombacis]|uniref:Heparinase II/III-like n=1 Tax=Ceraceosorus bombacis TaxID=401625 RepID=A0A0P1BHT2_9BASI|nr:Heparinase II/III-like [Ceraceosorus bombacis]